MTKTTITSLPGVFASGIASGIKTNGKPDLAYIFVPEAYGSAGVFTLNSFSAPPLEVCKRALAKGTIKAVVINSGNANAGTGASGLRDAQRTAAIAARALGIKTSEVAVTSTGIIGKALPMDRVEAGLRRLLENPFQQKGSAAARAIMTTDLTRKEVSVTGLVGGSRITIAGFGKGSGMIAPQMATMLGFFVTDAKANDTTLRRVLRQAVNDSFNMLSVDSDTSTNDMVLMLSTGKRGKPISSTKAEREFLALATRVCQLLAKMIAADGEGATKLIEARVHGARTEREAKIVAKNIINSPLVKTAIHGADPNWGRVLAAAGKDPSVKIKTEKVDLLFAGAPVMRNGRVVPHNRDKIRRLMRAKTVVISLDLRMGKKSATAWGCDLTHGYVDINVCYN